MKIYLAPMEGVTSNIFRMAQNKYFGGIDKFFTPFITPSHKGRMGEKIMRDILPKNNEGMNLVPQILTNSAQGFIEMCKSLEYYGYNEFNLNLGCPSGTVVSKGRGSGFLAEPQKLDEFLNEIYSTNYTISIKTRIGLESAEEFERLLDIYNKYPVSELIIHPRTRKDMYKNTPNMSAYEFAVENCKHSLCYNGDIFVSEDYEKFVSNYPNTQKIMIGRGVVSNPALPFMLKGGSAPDVGVYREFYNYIYEEYSSVLSGTTPLMHKLKEFILYMVKIFDDNSKVTKKIKKAKNINELNSAVDELFTHSLNENCFWKC